MLVGQTSLKIKSYSRWEIRKREALEKIHCSLNAGQKSLLETLVKSFCQEDEDAMESLVKDLRR